MNAKVRETLDLTPPSAFQEDSLLSFILYTASRFEVHEGLVPCFAHSAYRLSRIDEDTPIYQSSALKEGSAIEPYFNLQLTRTLTYG